MKNYLALIRKADFIDLFKYGNLRVNNDMVVDFKCEIEDLPLHKELFEELCLYANPFDNTFAYLIIHYIKESSSASSNDIFIEEVRHIYPLDKESKDNFEMSFDDRIRIDDPIWSDASWIFQKQQMVRECIKGAHNLRRILGFDIDSSDCRDIVSDDIVEEVVNELYEDIRPSGEMSIWTYLLRYERHSFYPHNTVGCFMDMVNVVCNRHAKMEVEEGDIQGTEIFRLLNKYRNTDIKFEELYGIVNEQSRKFVSMTNHYAPNVDFIKIASLFFILRNRYSDDFEFEPKFIDFCRRFGKDFELASYLLGIVLGHTHTYDCMYEILPLHIFKHKPSNPNVEIKESDSDKKINVESTDSPEQGTPKKDNALCTNEQKEPIAGDCSVVESEINGSPEQSSPEENDSCGVNEKKNDDSEETPSDNPNTPEKITETQHMPIFPCKMGKFNTKGKLDGRIKKNNPVIVQDRQEYLYYKSKGYEEMLL